ncbi:MAG: hypothetical protein EBX61_00240 [Betaproteobacteria bacterium]|nr:hypothetical protein [Betaproteobacteria bacterium]
MWSWSPAAFKGHRCSPLRHPLQRLGCGGLLRREIAARALGVHATAVILAHNHPSGLLEASQADRRLTEAINRALQTLDIQLLDHMIVAPNACLSFAQRGWI